MISPSAQFIWTIDNGYGRVTPENDEKIKKAALDYKAEHGRLPGRPTLMRLTGCPQRQVDAVKKELEDKLRTASWTAFIWTVQLSNGTCTTWTYKLCSWSCAQQIDLHNMNNNFPAQLNVHRFSCTVERSHWYEQPVHDILHWTACTTRGKVEPLNNLPNWTAPYLMNAVHGY